ncbi:hypothetical protein TNCV_586481 [Trichonephila clavipes]|nr:hypothetical protein TNCV_586481 [Trichonephila clavipes]
MATGSYMTPIYSPSQSEVLGDLHNSSKLSTPYIFLSYMAQPVFKELQNCEIFQGIELFTCSEVKSNSPPCTLSLKDYSKNRRVDGTRYRQDLQPQLLLVSRQYRQDLKIQQKFYFSPNSPKTASPRSTTEVIPRFPPALPKRPRQYQTAPSSFS